jgi:hypothetical protein
MICVMLARIVFDHHMLEEFRSTLCAGVSAQGRAVLFDFVTQFFSSKKLRFNVDSRVCIVSGSGVGARIAKDASRLGLPDGQRDAPQLLHCAHAPGCIAIRKYRYAFTSPQVNP